MPVPFQVCIAEIPLLRAETSPSQGHRAPGPPSLVRISVKSKNSMPLILCLQPLALETIREEGGDKPPTVVSSDDHFYFLAQRHKAIHSAGEQQSSACLEML